MSKLYSQGSKGPDVKEIQAALNYHIRRPAMPLNPDGIFGPKTDDRVREFQKRAGLVVDGIVGPNTLAVLYLRIAGGTEIELTPKKTEAQSAPTAGAGPRRHGLLPTVGVPLGGVRAGPVITRQAAPPVGPQPAPKKVQIKNSHSQGFDVSQKLVYDFMGDDEKKPKWKYTFSFNQVLPWRLGLPKPLKLSLDVKSSPLTSMYSMSGKIKVPFLEVKSPPMLFFPSGALKPYFFTGAGVNQNGFDSFNFGAGASLTAHLLNLKDRPLVPVISVVGDGGYKYTISPHDPHVVGKGYLQLSAVMKWSLPPFF